jgi:hypothetical protein
MSGKDAVFELMKNNKGTLESKQAVKAGIDNKVLQRLCKAGEIERVAKGVYIDANYYLLQELFPQSCKIKIPIIACPNSPLLQTSI